MIMTTVITLTFNIAGRVYKVVKETTPIYRGRRRELFFFRVYFLFCKRQT